ncbi:MAG: ABC transporter ATP-binding protein [bacterium]|nr:ABC transporter ATP-binding protein [bacterium]
MLMIRTENLSKVYLVKKFALAIKPKKTVALNRLNLEVQSGEIFGFLGPNGAGKTTTIKLILGLLFPTEGQTWLFEQPATRVDVKREIGFLPENPYFYDYLKGEEILHFMGQLYGINKSDRVRKVDELLKKVGLEEARSMPLRKYSKGMLQRIGLAQALLNDPKLVILDEPLTGLDPIGRKEIRDLILQLRDEGKTVFFSTHILSDAEMICDRVGMLMKGNLTKVGKLSELLNPQVKSIEIVIAGLSAEGKQQVQKFANRMKDLGNELVANLADEKSVPALLELIKQEQAKLVSLIPQKESLEEVFMREVKESQE